jgi:hypothetical protein
VLGNPNPNQAQAAYLPKFDMVGRVKNQIKEMNNV